MMDAALARRLFNYDADTGVLRWENHPTLAHLSGCAAGTVNGRGYIQVYFQKKNYYAHRLAWLMVHGEWPVDMIDHINGNPLDNRLSNLRSASRSQNAANRAKITAKSGYRGVRETPYGTFEAKIKVNRKGTHLGTFKTAEAASAAFRAAAVAAFGDYASKF